MKLSIGNRLAGMIACAVAMIATPVAAAEVLDQSALAGPLPVAPQAGRILTRAGYISPTTNNVLIGQTVTAGASGLLTRIEVQSFVFPQPNLTGALVLALFDGDVANGGTLVGESVKALFEVPTSALLNVPGVLTSFDVSGFGYQVTAGQRFSFGFAVDSSPQTAVGFILGNGSRPDPNAPPVFDYINYAGGTALTSVNFGPVTALTNRDIGFQTFVDTDLVAGVPEPGTWAILILGMAGVGGAMRRQRRRIACA